MLPREIALDWVYSLADRRDAGPTGNSCGIWSKRMKLVGWLVGGTGVPPVFFNKQSIYCHTFQTTELECASRPAGRRSHYMMKSDGISWLVGWLVEPASRLFASYRNG